MKLRRLTENGIEQFRTYLSQLRADPKQDVPRFLLTDEATSEAVPVDAEIEDRTFATRLEAAKYLDGVLTESGLPQIERDGGLWSWLSLLYFDQLCPPGKGGIRKPSKEDARYIAAVGNFQKYYRHLLLGPFTILRAHYESPNNALALLLSEPHVINDVVEQIASRQGWITNRAVVGAATRLYVDPESKSYKRGARGKGDGSPRRLSEVLDQFDMTYDLYDMTPESVLALLPKEFDRFRK